ncbi:Dps family protein [Deinococcus arcticus]|uniref:DNA starvation/stationary phase protection protein n=1 Tax=Deinococcus arcticus TaxID=2136176 RepID=A0A2T3W4L2_9DEIO|nr:Dps family protein [Deinococcus arcticus]PTA66831.1 DNA starvation/stationary phase protection protein [Deinococcus arcticus]
MTKKSADGKKAQSGQKAGERGARGANRGAGALAESGSRSAAPSDGKPAAGQPTGRANADAAHLNATNNALVDHAYLTEDEFGTVAETLQRNLATTISLYLKFKKYHWDIRGRFFRDLHLAYDEFIAMIFPAIDEQAERLVALGGSPIAAPADIERYSTVTVPTETVRDARTQVSDLVADLTRVGRGYRDDSQTVDDANDPATADLYNGYAATVDKIRWMLQAMMDDERMN